MNLSQETCLLNALITYAKIGESDSHCWDKLLVSTLVNYVYHQGLSLLQRETFLMKQLKLEMGASRWVSKVRI